MIEQEQMNLDSGPEVGAPEQDVWGTNQICPPKPNVQPGYEGTPCFENAFNTHLITPRDDEIIIL